MPNFSILLPPSEPKLAGGNPFAPDMFDYRSSSTFNYFNDLNPERRLIINQLHQVIEQGDNLESVFGMIGGELEALKEINRGIYNAPLMSALDRYSPGVLYQSMNFQGLPTGAQRRLLENGIIFSGLFGLLRPDDLIPNYDLKMDAELPGLGNISEFWRPALSRLLNRTLEGRVVWNLLPPGHREAWDDSHAYERKIEVRFVVESNGVETSLEDGIDPLRGQLVNYIVREALENVDGLIGWDNTEAFRFDPSATTTDEDTKSTTVFMIRRD